MSHHMSWTMERAAFMASLHFRTTAAGGESGWQATSVPSQVTGSLVEGQAIDVRRSIGRLVSLRTSARMAMVGIRFMISSAAASITA